MDLKNFHTILLVLLLFMVVFFMLGQVFRFISGILLLVVVTAMLIQVFSKDK